MSVKQSKVAVALLAIAAIAILGIPALGPAIKHAEPPDHSSRLVSVQDMSALWCDWDQVGDAGPTGAASSPPESPFAARLRGAASFLRISLQAQTLMTDREYEMAMTPDMRTRRTGWDPQGLGTSTHVRTIADTHPNFTSVGVNLKTNEVFLQDNNLWSYHVYNRLDNTPPEAPMMTPKRIVQGPATGLQFNNGIYVDPNNGDVYSVESDTGDKMTVFAPDARGNVKPKRTLYTPHRVFGIAADEEKGELYITVEYPPGVVVYRKEAEADEKPLRWIRGDRTQMETPHGIAIDAKNRLLFVNHWGQSVSFDGSEEGSGCCRNQRVPYGNPGTGKFNPSSITVYSLDAEGNVDPLRVIKGDRTLLNWPANMAVDQETGDLYVANDVGHSVLVFSGMRYINGNVPPTRAIKGDRTNLLYPTGVFVDRQNQELWVSNLGNGSANVYRLNANGNVSPIRIIRAAPRNHISMTFGRPASIAYDINREEILVPN